MRRTWVWVGAACLMSTLAACGDDDGGATRSATTAGMATETTAGAAVDFAGEVLIGTSQPLTGSFGGGDADNPLVTGFEQAVEDINAAGGVTIDGEPHELRLVIKDNESDANLMAQQVRSLVLEDGVVAQIGPPSVFGFQAIPIIDSLQIPTVMAGLPVDLFPSGAGSWWYASYLQSGDIAPQFLEFVEANGVANTVAVIANNDPVSQGFADGFEAAANAAGFQVVARALVPPGTTDFSDVISDAKSGGAEIVSVQLSPSDCPALLRQMKALDYKPAVFSAALCGLVPSWPELGELANGAVAALVWHPDIPGLPDADRLAAAFGDLPNNVARMAAVTGYQAVQILADAIDRAGTTDAEAIEAALASTDATFALGPVDFDEDHKNVVAVYQGQWQDGEIVPVYPEDVAGDHRPLIPYPGLQ